MAVRISCKNTNQLADVILFHRKLSGLSRIDLADIAGVGKTVIFDIEHGKETVKLNTLLKVMSALNINIILNSPVMKQYEESVYEKS